MDAETPDALMDLRSMSRLVWRCRRGMLENDIILERFFKRHGDALTQRQGACLTELMELSDNDLLDLHLGRKQPAQIDAKLDRPDVIELLGMLKVTAERARNETSR